MRDAKTIFEQVLSDYVVYRRRVDSEYPDFDAAQKALEEEAQRLREEFDRALEQEGW